MRIILLAALLGFSTLAGAASFFTEGFENPALPGWVIVNNSTPGGQTPEGWFQGTGVFTAHAGSPDSYVQANFENAGSPGDISTWLISPMLTLQPGSLFRFFTIGESVAGFPDRLEVRLSRNGASTNVGSTTTSVGDFTELLLTVNPNLEDNGYPTAWTEYSYSFSGLPAPVDSRIAFRYFVPDRDRNASTIAIDSVGVVPEPGTGILILGGLAAATLFRRIRTGVQRSSL